MSVLLSILIVIASIVLILFVLVQNSKGGGLASSFASSNQIMGVKKTTDFVEKVTWGKKIVTCVKEGCCFYTYFCVEIHRKKYKLLNHEKDFIVIECVLCVLCGRGVHCGALRSGQETGGFGLR